MIAVILQPSYIPWRGYFDQIRRAETFIFYDDAQYDKHGWRNRNQIKTANGKRWLTIPVHSGGVTSGMAIKDVRIDWSKPWVRKHLHAFAAAYGKAPFYKDYMPLMESFYDQRPELIADLTIETTIRLARELGIESTPYLRSSELAGITGRKTERLIQILERVGADHYLSGPSARSYLDPAAFAEAGIKLEYMEYQYPEYQQLYPPFDPYVSIVDLLFMTGSAAKQYFVAESAPNHGT